MPPAQYFVLIITFLAINALDLDNILFIIIDQYNINKYHRELSDNLTDSIIEQSQSIISSHKDTIPTVYSTSTDFLEVQAPWTLLPLIPILSKIICQKTNKLSWIVFLDERTQLNLKKLLPILKKYDPTKELWIGHALEDSEATIIHHFAFFKDPTFFKYPNLASGFAFTVPLIHTLANKFNNKSRKRIDFNIDVSHEFALFVWDNGKGAMLTHESLFCTSQKQNCATFPMHFRSCSKEIMPNSIYFIVKTCHKYHKDRVVNVVKKTWGKFAAKIKYFSDFKDENIPTINLGIPNTEQGHCQKTLTALKYAYNDILNDPQTHWVAVVDDDTILSLSRFHSLLTCYHALNDNIALGERYRYNGYTLNLPEGYDYLTGGAGMIFNKKVLKKLVETCYCPSINTPDDMQIGICLASMNVQVVHSKYFHQARPLDYAPGYLATNDAVSFHKYWMLDPVKVYRDMFEKEDRRFFTDNGVKVNYSPNMHSEL